MFVQIFQYVNYSLLFQNLGQQPDKNPRTENPVVLAGYRNTLRQPNSGGETYRRGI